jgi:ribosomal protein L37AE/L43A
MKTKITNCEACIKYSLVRKYYDEWLCDDCISLISKIANRVNFQLSQEELQLELRRENAKKKSYT